MFRLLPGLAVSMILAACALDIAGPRTDLAGLPEGLEVTLALEPGEVAQHEPFAVELTVSNTTTQTIEVVTRHGCLVLPHVLRGGQRIPFRGSAWGCTAAITTHTFLPGGTLTRRWEMSATLYAQHPGDVEGAPAPRGTYTVQAEFDTRSVGPLGAKPVIEKTLRVR